MGLFCVVLILKNACYKIESAQALDTSQLHETGTASRGTIFRPKGQNLSIFLKTFKKIFRIAQFALAQRSNILNTA